MTTKLPNLMKAVVFGEANGPLNIIEKSLPEPQMGELLVRIKAVSICASDFIPWKGYIGNVMGLVPGHEGVGIVVAVNGPASGFSVGDKVGFTNTRHACGHCDVCLVGQDQFCTCGRKNQGFDSDGFFAEYAVIAASSAVRVPEELPLERLAPLFCAGITAFRAVKQLDAPARGTIGIFGLGGVGAFAVRFAVAMGFEVLGFDISAGVRDSCKKLGVHAAFDSSRITDILDDVKKVTAGRLLDGAIVAAGAPAAYSAALQLTAPLKTVVAVGVPRDPIQVEAVNFITKGLVLKGTVSGTASDLGEMMRLVQRYQIVPDITLEPFEKLPELFLQSAVRGTGGKLGAVLF